MQKKVIAIVVVLVAAAFGAGIYFKNDAVRFFYTLDKQAAYFQKTDLGTTISKISTEILTPTPLNSGGKSSSQHILLQSKIILETNLQRQANGNLPALKENEKLNEAAAAKANDMFKNQYFEHVSPSGVDPGKLVQSFGYDYIMAGENLILGNFASEKEVVQDWMNSPGHRANILNTRYSEIGSSIVKGTYKGETVWIGVQEFGLPLSACSQPEVSLKNQIDTDKAKLDDLSAQIDAKKQQINNTDPHSEAYNQMVDDYNQLVVQYNALAQTTKNIIARYNAEINTFNICVSGSLAPTQ